MSNTSPRPSTLGMISEFSRNLPLPKTAFNNNNVSVNNSNDFSLRKKYELRTPFSGDRERRGDRRAERM
jgi:hypothetical protein